MSEDVSMVFGVGGVLLLLIGLGLLIRVATEIILAKYGMVGLGVEFIVLGFAGILLSVVFGPVDHPPDPTR